MQDIFVESLKRLCEEQGGYGPVAERIKAHPQTLYQIVSGIKLGSGRARSVGPDLRGRLDLHYPGWLRTAGQLESPVRHLVNVPLLANAAEMGAGAEQMNEDIVVGQLALQQDWLLKNLRPSSIGALRFIHALGDSMTPTFQDGDVLLVDSGVIDVRIDGVYVLEAHERLFIKRVRQRLDGAFVVSSDNPQDKVVDVLDGKTPIRVKGRVIWCWNGHRL